MVVLSVYHCVMIMGSKSNPAGVWTGNKPPNHSTSGHDLRIHQVELLLTASQQSHTQSANGKSHMSMSVVVMQVGQL